MENGKDTAEYFRLRSLITAKVSEISEATTASPVPAAERINFHIGNPVQDPRLNRLYYKLATGIEPDHDLQQDDTCWTSSHQDLLQLIRDAIDRSVPYMPRGGYLRDAPGALITEIKQWLTINQPEPLEYDFGESSGIRECIIVSGGRNENLRVVFHSLNSYLVQLPAKIITHQLDLPDFLLNFENLNFHHSDGPEPDLLQLISQIFTEHPEQPVFLVPGSELTEVTRREIRKLCLSRPLSVIEVNDTPNHLSLAREAKMRNRVLRIISSRALLPDIIQLPISFVAGNADFIRVFENVHFELKGTPPAAEVELFSYLLHHKKQNISQGERLADPAEPEVYDPAFSIAHTPNSLHHIAATYTSKSGLLERIGSRHAGRAKHISGRIIRQYTGTPSYDDPLYAQDPAEITENFIDSLHDKIFPEQLYGSFLTAFVAQHPEYNPENCIVSSGSSRTALSLLGFHCGIEEVISCDLSWTYHHCFPKTTTVPLTDDLALDIPGIMAAVESVSGYSERKPAVVINNPHNASGKVFSEQDISQLLRNLLTKKIFVIDDLSYENVAPAEDLPGIKTLRQIGEQLFRNGYLGTEDLDYLITVHSLSKTDCFAGARMAVVEINHPDLLARFRGIAESIKPNLMALLLTYLFYRNSADDLRGYWVLRNRIMNERMQAMEQAGRNLPKDRDPFRISIVRPGGSMYPHLVVNNLPRGLSLDWLASGLARRGIGLIPLTAFSQTAQGYELARKSFRLTLGGPVNSEELYRKTRRVLIDLNRLISEESAKYNLNEFLPVSVKYNPDNYYPKAPQQWEQFNASVRKEASKRLTARINEFSALPDIETLDTIFNHDHLPFRLGTLKNKFFDQVLLRSVVCSEIYLNRPNRVLDVLATEFYKENQDQRAANFRHRLFDRTVHPTQSYSLKVDLIMEEAAKLMLQGSLPRDKTVRELALALIDEFLGLNVPIRAVEEGNELVQDLKAMILGEEYTRWHADAPVPASLLSFWGDWDGSTRPSGQGHLLVSAVLLENVDQLASLVKMMIKLDPGITISAELRQEIQNLETSVLKFWQLLTNINKLTNQLEQRYLTVLPFNFSASKVRRVATKYKLARDPLKVLWQHNDRLEKKMLELRNQRRNSMEYYFGLNKKLRKVLHDNLDRFPQLFADQDFAARAGSYRSLLQRFNLTPRIHQNMITSVDQFAIDTTVHNMLEINEIAGKYGNPGMILALQISMSEQPEALIALDSKIRSHRETFLREQPDLQLPSIWLIPLFEDIETVDKLTSYLDRLWEYSIQSRRIDQETGDRFSEMICEIFIAGSDLSQQVSQPTAALKYKEAKLSVVKWLAEKGLADKVRIKLGSGEPMQRQGGYYSTVDRENPFITSRNARLRMNQNLTPAAQKSTEFARSPLQGILSSGDLRTFQSNVFEKIKLIKTEERARLLYHVRATQKAFEDELYRISEPFLDTRLQFRQRGHQELERLSFGQRDPIYSEFSEMVTQNFRRILYGSDEDVVGIHVISYFISRTTPVLRDRPTVRPTREIAADQSQKIIQRIAQTLPLSRHGTLLRAIGHNRAQSMILGVNQLTTGLFRTLDEFAGSQKNYSDGLALISDRILPALPVHEILYTLRIYHEPGLTYLQKMDRAFPASNSAFLYLREDLDSMAGFIGLLQMEFIRRHGLDVGDFFESGHFKPSLLPALTPALAVLLQPDIFNTSEEQLRSVIGGKIDDNWLDQIRPMLDLPERIGSWRRQTWQMIEQPIFTQVKSFVELAHALNTLTAGKSSEERGMTITPSRIFRMGSNIASLLHGIRDDSLRQFLTSVVQYLTELPGSSQQVPINILRAMEDIETIIKIEEQALSRKEQDLLRFYILQMARLAGENG